MDARITQEATMAIGAIHTGGPQFTDNGSFESTEELLKDGSVPPEQVMMAKIINTTLAKEQEMENRFRTSAAQALGKGVHVDTRA